MSDGPAKRLVGIMASILAPGRLFSRVRGVERGRVPMDWMAAPRPAPTVVLMSAPRGLQPRRIAWLLPVALAA